MTYRKKLIEVSLPIEKINSESAREKLSRQGNISTLHLYWARRPLASCRAVLFGMLVDDPSSVPEEYPTLEDQEIERNRLHRLLEKLVACNGNSDENILHQSRWEIARSIGRDAEIGPPPLELKELSIHNQRKQIKSLVVWINKNGPIIHDPFCGGGAIPLEAKRLGLTSRGTDLNPLAVLISKSIIENPTAFVDKPSINPTSEKTSNETQNGLKGLSDDVRYYGEYVKKKALEKVRNNYAKVLISKEMVSERPDLKKYLNQELTPVAWIWCRTVRSPNPAFANIHTPLIKSNVISKKKGKERWVETITQGNGCKFVVRTGRIPAEIPDGNVTRSGGACLISNSPIPLSYIRSEGMSGKLSRKLMAIVLEGEREKVYISPIKKHEELALGVKKTEEKLGKAPEKLTGGTCYGYGFTTFSSLFTSRQFMTLCAFSDAIIDLKSEISPINKEYSKTLITYLSMALGRSADYWSSISSWSNSRDGIRNTFGRQAIPMTWDFAEANPFSSSTGCWMNSIKWIERVIMNIPWVGIGEVEQKNIFDISPEQRDVVFCTDPPYYDNIAYADLSDYFYVWHKRTLREEYPSLFSTILTPKMEELTALKYRRGGINEAEEFFLNGMKKAIGLLQNQSSNNFPLCFYYAFKQQESSTGGKSSTGWSTFLEATISSGFNIVGTIPMRTEQSTKLLGKNANILSTSAVLVCRKRSEDASTVRRTEFLRELRQELEPAVKALQEGGISPVDLAQAAIGPGIGVFSKYSAVLEADGSHMSVRRALEIINQELSVILGETDDEIDSESRVCLRWFSSFGENPRVYGELDSLLRSLNASSEIIEKFGCMVFSEGKVRIAEIESYPTFFTPKDMKNVPVWAHVHRLIRLLNVKGEIEAAAYMKNMSSHQRDSVRSLTYRLYQVCDEKKMMEQAKNYNTLAISWGQVVDRSQKPAVPNQATLFEY